MPFVIALIKIHWYLWLTAPKAALYPLVKVKWRAIKEEEDETYFKCLLKLLFLHKNDG